MFKSDEKTMNDREEFENAVKNNNSGRLIILRKKKYAPIDRDKEKVKKESTDDLISYILNTFEYF